MRELIATQLLDGYLGTYLEADRWRAWDLWAHKYDLIGLLNYYRRTAYLPALEACKRIGDLVCKIYSPNGKNIVLLDKHVGMANTSILEPMVMLHRYTGEKRYLDFCQYIVKAWDDPQGPKIISTLLSARSVRKVANNKSYEMMSNLVGLLELYRLTGDETFLKPVVIAWQDIREKRLYLTGTTSWREHFKEDGVLRADDAPGGGVGEGCVTVTWMQMNLQLLRLTGEARYAEELERSIYNALLGSQHPGNATICYFTPLNGGKQYGAVSHGIPGVSCCTSSIPRGIALLPTIAWGAMGRGIAINLYAPGRAAIKVQTATVKIESVTNYPESGQIDLTVSPVIPTAFPIFLRVPAWTSRFVAKAGGKEWVGKPGSYLEIERRWSAGDHIHISMDTTLHTRTGEPAYPGYVAVQRGPQVLAADMSLNPDLELWIAGIKASGPISLSSVAAAPPPKWIGTQRYEMDGYFGNEHLGKRPTKIVLTPFSDAGQLNGEYRVWLQKP